MIEGFELQAAVFRRLLRHLNGEHADVGDADLVEVAGFDRNQLAHWYREAAAERLLDLSEDEAREAIYGMPYAEWRAAHPDATKAAETRTASHAGR